MLPDDGSRQGAGGLSCTPLAAQCVTQGADGSIADPLTGRCLLDVPVQLQPPFQPCIDSYGVVLPHTSVEAQFHVFLTTSNLNVWYNTSADSAITKCIPGTGALDTVFTCTVLLPDSFIHGDHTVFEVDIGLQLPAEPHRLAALRDDPSSCQSSNPFAIPDPQCGPLKSISVSAENADCERNTGSRRLRAGDYDGGHSGASPGIKYQIAAATPNPLVGQGDCERAFWQGGTEFCHPRVKCGFLFYRFSLQHTVRKNKNGANVTDATLADINAHVQAQNHSALSPGCSATCNTTHLHQDGIQEWYAGMVDPTCASYANDSAKLSSCTSIVGCGCGSPGPPGSFSQSNTGGRCFTPCAANTYLTQPTAKHPYGVCVPDVAVQLHPKFRPCVAAYALAVPFSSTQAVFQVFLNDAGWGVWWAKGDDSKQRFNCEPGQGQTQNVWSCNVFGLSHATNVYIGIAPGGSGAAKCRASGSTPPYTCAVGSISAHFNGRLSQGQCSGNEAAVEPTEDDSSAHYEVSALHPNPNVADGTCELAFGPKFSSCQQDVGCSLPYYTFAVNRTMRSHASNATALSLATTARTNADVKAAAAATAAGNLEPDSCAALCT
eukprot:g1372.t1